jgi:hypothetical protein
MSSASGWLSYAIGAGQRVFWNPADTAAKAATLGMEFVSNRRPEDAVQACFLDEIDPETERFIFAQPPKTWPSSKAHAYFEMAAKLDQMVTNATDDEKKAIALAKKFVTEQIGIEGCMHRMQVDSKWQIDEFHLFYGPNVVNIFAEDSTGRVWVGEAKGGGSQLKGNQGTLANLKAEAKKMKNSTYKTAKYRQGETEAEQTLRSQQEQARRRQTGQTIEDAIAAGNITFITTSTPVSMDDEPKKIKEVKLQ